MDIKKFYTVEGRSKRTNFSLRSRVEAIAKVANDEIYRILTDTSDKFGRARHKFHTLMDDENSDLSAYEAAVLCDVIGCTILELMDRTIDLRPIYQKKIEKDEKDKAFKDYNFVKTK